VKNTSIIFIIIMIIISLINYLIKGGERAVGAAKVGGGSLPNKERNFCFPIIKYVSICHAKHFCFNNNIGIITPLSVYRRLRSRHLSPEKRF
jgi:hypothetical protein